MNSDSEMSERVRWVIGNWKMNGSLATNAPLLEAIAARAGGSARVAVCAPFPYLTQLQRSLRGTKIAYGAQDVSEHTSGAYTGQISAGMLKEFGATVVLVGHSERRLYNAETSHWWRRKRLRPLPLVSLPSSAWAKRSLRGSPDKPSSRLLRSLRRVPRSSPVLRRTS